MGFWHGKYTFFGIVIPAGVPDFVVPLITVVETISYIFRLVSVSIRLFANVFAGHILIHVLATAIYGLVLNFSSGFLISNIIHSFFLSGVLLILFVFELMISFLQAYIFIVLNLLYWRDYFMFHHSFHEANEELNFWKFGHLINNTKLNFQYV